MKVSICIPAYNQMLFMKRCLDSISIQTYKDYEIVISDDSPNNYIQDLIQNYKHLPILYRKNEKALGSPENWNNTIRLASGEYIKIMHHDDWFSSAHSLEKYTKLLDDNPQIFFGFSACRAVNENKETSHHLSAFKLKALKKNADILFSDNFIGAPSTTIFRRNTNLFFDKNLIWFVDVDFYIRFLRQYPSFIYSDKELVSIGLSENQITNSCVNNKALIRKERDYIDKKLNPEFGCSYKIYHQIRNEFIPRIKRLIK